MLTIQKINEKREERKEKKERKKGKKKKGKEKKKGREKKKEERERKGKEGTLENIVGAASCAHASRLGPAPKRSEVLGAEQSRQCERSELTNLSDLGSSK